MRRGRLRKVPGREMAAEREAALHRDTFTVAPERISGARSAVPVSGSKRQCSECLGSEYPVCGPRWSCRQMTLHDAVRELSVAFQSHRMYGVHRIIRLSARGRTRQMPFIFDALHILQRVKYSSTSGASSPYATVRDFLVQMLFPDSLPSFLQV